MNTTPSGLQYDDTTVGEGPVAGVGQGVAVHYTGWLLVDGEQGATGSTGVLAEPDQLRADLQT